MISRFIVRSTLVICLIFSMGTTAWAVISNTSTTQTSCTTKLRSAGLCSIEVEGLLKGLGAVVSGSNATPIAFTATLLIRKGTVFCKNPAGNSLEGNGIPFSDLEVKLEGAETIGEAQVTRNGRALSDILFHDDQMVATVEQALETTITCQHANWIRVIVVQDLEVLGQQVSDPDPNNTTCFLTPAPDQDFIIDASCNIDDSLRNTCVLPEPYFSDPKSAIWKEIPYDCTEICHSTDPTQCNLTTP